MILKVPGIPFDNYVALVTFIKSPDNEIGKSHLPSLPEGYQVLNLIDDNGGESISDLRVVSVIDAKKTNAIHDLHDLVIKVRVGHVRAFSENRHSSAKEVNPQVPTYFIMRVWEILTATK